MSLFRVTPRRIFNYAVPRQVFNSVIPRRVFNSVIPRRIFNSVIPRLDRGIHLLALLLALAAGGAQAEQREFGDYVVHFSAVNSTFLTPEIAQRYGIVRGTRNGFLNIAVQKKAQTGSPRAVTAAISGSKWNLLQESQVIDFTEVREGEAIYYIGQFEFSNAEPVRFALEIQPEGEGSSYSLEWDTRLYIN